MLPAESSANSMSHGVLYVYPVPMTSRTAGHAFHVGTRPPSGSVNGLPVAGSGQNHSALLYQSGSVLTIGPGLEGLFAVSQGLFATNRIFFVSTGSRRAALVDHDSRARRGDFQTKSRPRSAPSRSMRAVDVKRRFALVRETTIGRAAGWVRPRACPRPCSTRARASE